MPERTEARRLPSRRVTLAWSGLRGAAGPAILACVLAALIWRLPLGIDLSDESYYAIFIDDWLKGGIASSSLTTVHQTALLWAYPPMLAFQALTGSADGLVLALRCLFLAGSIAMALAWLAFLRRVQAPFFAWAGAAFALAFVPFGLPSVSYNTLGMQGLGVALAALGCAFLRLHEVGEPRRAAGWAVLSAGGWAVAVTAYPSLVVPLGVCLLLLATLRDLGPPVPRLAGTPLRGRVPVAVLGYAALVAAGQILAWAAIAWALTPQKLLDSLAYLAAINDVGGWGRKLDFSLGLLRTYETFAIACIGAIIVGLLRIRLGAGVTALLTAGLVGFLFTAPYALFCRSHDVVTVLALTGFGLLARLGPGSAPHDRALALVWTVSFAAGLTTLASAFNSLFNFPVGAAAAAVAALGALRPVGAPSAAASGLAHAAGIGGVLATSLLFFYGDLPNAPLPSERVREGAFAGLLGQPEQVSTIRWMRDDIAPLVGPDGRIAFVGRIYGLILATAARPQMLAVFPLDETMNPRGLAISRRFFERANHRPSLVVTHADEYIRPLNPFGPNFGDWYERILSEDGAMGSFEVFRRRPEPGG
jgi:hypothetical protein